MLDNGLYEGNTEYYRYNQHTNWQDELFTESFKQNYSLTVTGGDNIAVYALALGYQVNESLIKENDYSRFNARVNTDIDMTDRLSMRTHMSFVYGKRNLTDEGEISSTNPMYAALMKSPFMSPNVYDTQGNVSPKLDEVDTWGFSNPNAITENAMQENSNYGFLGSVELRYKVWRSLNFSSLVGLRFYKERERIFLPENGIAHADLLTSVVTNSMQQRVERMMSLSNETCINYLFKFAHNHSLGATLGFCYQHNKAEDDWAKGYNSPSDEFVSLGTGLNALSQIGGTISSWNWMAMYANASYNLKNRYFLSATASFDASS
ncbi:MAG: hypothetical protein LUD15_07020 [Bacteroides sp.]|nr:hypothetical protein [Bacteroides sp.]